MVKTLKEIHPELELFQGRLDRKGHTVEQLIETLIEKDQSLIPEIKAKGKDAVLNFYMQFGWADFSGKICEFYPYR